MTERPKANKVRRIHKAPIVRGTAEVILHFTGGLDVRPGDCPRGISAFPHWHPDPKGGEYAVCECLAPAAPPAPAVVEETVDA